LGRNQHLPLGDVRFQLLGRKPAHHLRMLALQVVNELQIPGIAARMLIATHGSGSVIAIDSR
jgi:hypothetical protein